MNWNLNVKKLVPGATAAGKTILGMSCAGATSLIFLIDPWEGRHHMAFLDELAKPPVWTVCNGVTGEGVIIGKYYTDEECDRLEAAAINRHEAGLDKCLVHEEALPVETKAALISFTYNVGVGNACRSTVVKKVNQGDLWGACEGLSDWVYAGGVKLKGLENRRYKGDAQRISERTLCRIGIDASYKTPLYEKWHVKYKNWKTKMAADEI